MGMVQGRVITLGGHPVPHARVVAFPPGNLMGGMLYARTNEQGRFRMMYHGEAPLAYVKVDGGERVDNVPNGANLTLRKV
ncbi:MAG: carboxypeptidase-like regulatory domain-containing protein [Fimbriimonadaceae bacterium]